MSLTPARRAELAAEAAHLVCVCWMEQQRGARSEAATNAAYDRAQAAILDALLRAESSPAQAEPHAETCGATPPVEGCDRAPGHGGDHQTVDGICWRNEHPDAYRRPAQAEPKEPA